ncbi:MAG: valine--tRNA ligase [Endomicrobium sp.]|jgi:valyl-tRNA synthetase|nr:valine--tRNA ligase [Endomicrobium sp.]
MEKMYDFKKNEEKWCEYWLKNETFFTKINNNKFFTIVMPPPNITGHLHIGHALNNTLQDIIIKFQKINGCNTLWIPGIDHGGIATQNVVEKHLKKEGKTRNDIGRDDFLKKMLDWKNKTANTILNQLKKLGCGFDFDKIAFTMDKSRTKAVKKAFVKLFKRGLIYKGERLINWCHNCSTALSDIEVEYEREKSTLWYIKYPLINTDEHVVVSTTRPETIFGDTAIAVNPKDKRYINLIGKLVKIPLINKEIAIISDQIIDESFGSGAVKITPAHDPVDNEIAMKNKLKIIKIINVNGKMINVPREYSGLTVSEARKKVINDLYSKNFILKMDDYTHSVGKCYRCSTKIEPLMSSQWFLNVKNMSKNAIKAVNDEKILFYPKSWKKPCISWLENLKDWCISRQIWWGHKIPIYYCVDDKNNRTKCKPIASINDPKKCPYCKNVKLVQDEDVLDTWFSSALWPISVFNWGENENCKELACFYPTSVLVTGHEILYLWVARMIQFGIEFTKKVPFCNVFIHGTIRDKYGKKMSKSIGNVIDPLEIMHQYGTDALRFSLAHIAIPGKDMQISNTLFLVARNFVNKIWNASRFIIMNLDKIDVINEKICPTELFDKWIITELINSSIKIRKFYESYNIDNVAKEIYDFFWTKYCDWYIEFSKIRITSLNINIKKQTLSILVYVLRSILQLMYPIIPFITSEIWEILNKKLYKNEKILAECTLFDIQKKYHNESSIEEMNIIQNIVVKIRALLIELNIQSTIKVNLLFNFTLLNNKNIEEVIKKNKDYIEKFSKIRSIKFCNDILKPKNSAMIIIENIEIFLLLNGIINIENEKKRLIKEIDFANQEIKKNMLKLSSEDFIKKAPIHEIEKTKMRLNEAVLKTKKISKNLESII